MIQTLHKLLISNRPILLSGYNAKEVANRSISWVEQMLVRGAHNKSQDTPCPPPCVQCPRKRVVRKKPPPCPPKPCPKVEYACPVEDLPDHCPYKPPPCPPKCDKTPKKKRAPPPSCC